ncbi:MAG TPA: hypothetical protein VGR45_06315 [Stellaceae bacterium]|nr:hypothetical protein [Stellaceae bacterium]
MTTYSNPRMSAVIEDWPIGRKTCAATFQIEQNGQRGERAVRTTIGKPKKLTYATKARIVDGDDGRTYIVELAYHGGITVMKGTMDHVAEPDAIWPRDPRYAEMLALFD